MNISTLLKSIQTFIDDDSMIVTSNRQIYIKNYELNGITVDSDGSLCLRCGE